MNEVTHVRGLSTGPAYYWEVDVLENGEGPQNHRFSGQGYLCGHGRDSWEPSNARLCGKSTVLGVWEKQWFERAPCVPIKEILHFFLSALPPTTKSFEPPSGSPPTLPSTLVNRPVANHVVCDFPPFGLGLVCAQVYLSSEKGSSQLASCRIVSPSLWFCVTVLAQPLVGP